MPSPASVMTASVVSGVDLRDRADEGGLAHAEATRHHDLRRDRRRGRDPVRRSPTARKRTGAPGATAPGRQVTRGRRSPLNTLSINARSGVLPALLAFWCTVTTPSPAMSPSSTRATPSGTDRSAATSATERLLAQLGDRPVLDRQGRPVPGLARSSTPAFRSPGRTRTSSDPESTCTAGRPEPSTPWSSRSPSPGPLPVHGRRWAGRTGGRRGRACSAARIGVGRTPPPSEEPRRSAGAEST